jgi:MoxR-like ATPase
MATTKKTTSSDLKYVPAAGVDKEYDERLAAALTSIKSTHVGFDEDDVRLAIAKMIATERGQKLSEAFVPPPPPEPEKPTVIDFSAVEKVVKAGTDKYFYVPEQTTMFIDWWIEMRRRFAAVGAMIITGPSGIGKTELLISAGRDRGEDVFVQHTASVTDPELWLGHKEIDENGTRWVFSDFLKALQRPGLVVIDEINRVHSTVLSVILPILDGQQRVLVPGAEGERGEPVYVSVHPECKIAATANLGYGYTGTYQLDIAVMERFAYRIPIEWPDEKEEVKILTMKTGISSKDAERLVWIAAKTRDMAKTEAISRGISTRSLLHWAMQVATGMPIARAAEYSVLGQYRDEGGEQSDLMKVKVVIEGKGGR